MGIRGRAVLKRRRCAIAILASLCVASSATAQVRPLSDAERAMTQVAAAYLSRGAEAVYENLSASSVFRALPHDEALAEIEARLGPPAGATWEVDTVVTALKDKAASFSISYPSGIDETVVMELVREGEAYRVADLRITAQRAPRVALFPSFENEPRETTPAESPLPLLLLAAILVAAALSAVSALIRFRNATGSRLALVLAAVVISATSFAAISKWRAAADGAGASTLLPKKKDQPFLRLATLLPLRRALASGTGGFDGEYQKVGRIGAYGEIADLWKAEEDLQQIRIEDVKRTLSRFPSPSDTPLVEILRARLAFFQHDEVAAAIAYEHAVNLGPGRDSLWYESAQALSVLGFDDQAAGYLQRLTRIGSRRADVYYSLAVLAAAKGHDDESARFLKTAWSLRPEMRARLIETAVLWSVIRRPDVSAAIPLSAAAEASFSSPSASSRPILLPVGAEPRISGDLLQVKIGEQELLVPGGADLAPVGTAVVDPLARSRTEEERALGEYPQLLTIARSTGAYTQPALRARVKRAAAALASRNRWNDLVRLTDGLAPTSEQVPSELFFLRDQALQRLDRRDEARRLLVDLASSRVLQRKNDAMALYALGEMLASFDLYDDAVKMLDRADATRHSASIDNRVRQLQMNKRLATKYNSLRTPHFEIHYPDDLTPNAASQIGRVLEAEFVRLQQWVPTANFKPVVVNILWWNEFRATYTGNDFILGFYEGKITVPFAGVGELVPQVVTLLSHELCHAMIAQATNDQAPSWFQEGLAQRVEMTPYHRNAFNMYEDNKLLAVSLLDAVLRGSPDPEMITEAYVEAQTIIRFIEAKYGHGGIGKMIKAFHDGATNEEALALLTGGTVADFDVKLRAWGRSSGWQVFENPEPIHYDTVDDQIHWSHKGSP
jgi:tetratricopeptide (TPR) repeat protein